MTSRLVLVATSHRVAPGLLSWPAWAALRRGPVYAGRPDHPQLPYLAAAGLTVAVLDPADPAGGSGSPGPTAGPAGSAALARHLVEVAAARGHAVWLAAPDGDPELGAALARELTGRPGPNRPELEVVQGSYDLPGARLLDLVAVMDRLRSPGGCPWDAAQSHASLLPFLVEEAYEVVEAVETGDRAHLREELGDLLLQVVFHARLAEEHPEDPWSVDDVAAGIVAKLVRRHPHVFAAEAGGAEVSAADVAQSWETRKAEEKGRRSAADGVPLGQPALALAAALVGRARRHGVPVAAALPEPLDPGQAGDPAALGALLLALVAAAEERGVDAEAALRAAARDLRTRLLGAAPPDPDPAPGSAPGSARGSVGA